MDCFVEIRLVFRLEFVVETVFETVFKTIFKAVFKTIFKAVFKPCSKNKSTSFTWLLSVKTAPEKPRFIIIGFQTAKDGDQTKNSSTFNHVNLKNAYVTLNSDRYPAVDYNLSFANQKFPRVYGDAALFEVKFIGMDELITQSSIIASDYKTLYISFHVRCQQAERKIQILCC